MRHRSDCRYSRRAFKSGVTTVMCRYARTLDQFPHKPLVSTVPSPRPLARYPVVEVAVGSDHEAAQVGSDVGLRPLTPTTTAMRWRSTWDGRLASRQRHGWDTKAAKHFTGTLPEGLDTAGSNPSCWRHLPTVSSCPTTPAASRAPEPEAPGQQPGAPRTYIASSGGASVAVGLDMARAFGPREREI